jgi:hypothetical protein
MDRKINIDRQGLQQGPNKGELSGKQIDANNEPIILTSSS